MSSSLSTPEGNLKGKDQGGRWIETKNAISYSCQRERERFRTYPVNQDYDKGGRNVTDSRQKAGRSGALSVLMQGIMKASATRSVPQKLKFKRNLGSGELFAEGAAPPKIKKKNIVIQIQDKLPRRKRRVKREKDASLIKTVGVVRPIRVNAGRSELVGIKEEKGKRRGNLMTNLVQKKWHRRVGSAQAVRIGGLNSALYRCGAGKFARKKSNWERGHQDRTLKNHQKPGGGGKI